MTRTFSLTDGGPFYQLVRRLRMLRPSGMVRSWWFALVLWLPIALGEVVRALRDLPADATLLDLSPHVRILFSMPVFLLSERLIDAACRGSIAAMYGGELCDRGGLDRIIDRAERLRDAWWPELLLLALAITGGQLSLWGVFGGIHGGPSTEIWSFPRMWYASIALPLVQFLMWRWLWRWLIWCYVLAGIARLPLAALATHPDRAAGLEPLAWPSSAFSGFVLAVSAILASAWGTQLIAHRARLQDLAPGALVFLLGVVVIAIGPLLMFCGHLYRARRRTMLEYTDFARRYTRQFHEKWIAQDGTAESPLGSADIQALNDLGGSFEVIGETRVLVFSPRKVLTLLVAAALPMLPLIASTFTLQQVAERVAKTVLGGLPI